MRQGSDIDSTGFNTLVPFLQHDPIVGFLGGGSPGIHILWVLHTFTARS